MESSDSPFQVRGEFSVSKTECDIVVAGGGPAGSTIALKLAEEGFNVVLVERLPRTRFWRKKCESFCSESVLKTLDVDFEYDGPYVERLLVMCEDGREINEFETRVIVLPRESVGQKYADLLSDLGVRILDRCEVRDFLIEREKQRVRVAVRGKREGSITARLLVDCTGIESTIRKRLAEMRNEYKVDESELFEAYVELVSAEACRELRDSIAIVLGDSILKASLAWIGGAKYPLSLGVVSPRSLARERSLPLLAFDLRRVLRLRGRVAESFAGVLSGRRPLESIVSDAVVLAGDAALLSSPLFLHGIQGAIESSKLLTPALIKALETSELPTLEDLWPCNAAVKTVFVRFCLAELILLYFLSLDLQTRLALLEVVPTRIPDMLSLVEMFLSKIREGRLVIPPRAEKLAEDSLKLLRITSQSPSPRSFERWRREIASTLAGWRKLVFTPTRL